MTNRQMRHYLPPDQSWITFRDQVIHQRSVGMAELNPEFEGVLEPLGIGKLGRHVFLCCDQQNPSVAVAKRVLSPGSI